MKKIAHVVSFLNYGGSKKYVIDLINYGFKFQYPYQYFLITLEKKNNPKVLSNIPKCVEILELNTKNQRCFHDFGEYQFLVNFLKFKKIDIVHTHDRAPDFMGTMAGIRSNSKIISTVHNLDYIWKNNSLKDYYHRIKEKTRLHKTDFIIAISSGIKEYFLSHTHFDPNRIFLIRHGIEVNKFQVSNHNPDLEFKEKIKIGLIGRFTKQKGQDFFIKVVKSIQNYNDKFHFYFVGEGELKKFIQNEIQKQSINNITLMDNIDWIPSFLKSIDLLVIPSRWEGFGIVAIEAMASGLPVFASNVMGLNEIIKDQKTGLLLPADDIHTWNNAILKFSKKQGKLWGAEGEKRVKKYFSINRMIKSTYEIYNLINEK